MLEGLWRSRGYGWLLQIAADSYRLEHVSRINRLHGESGMRELFGRNFDRIRVDSECLRLHQAGDLTEYEFLRVDSREYLPPLLVAPTTDPVSNFETLWHLFDEHYAFFALHGVDWAGTYGRYRPLISSNSSPAELFAIMAEALAPLEDGHVSLCGAGQTFQPLQYPALRKALQKAFDLPAPRVSPRVTVERISRSLAKALLAPFEGTRTPVQQACNGILSWCRLKPSIGYLSVLRMFGFADTVEARGADDLPHFRSDVADFLRADMEALEAALDRVVDQLHDCTAMVLDLRINGGGFDRAALAIAQRFAGHAVPVLSKRAVSGAGHTAAQHLSIGSVARPFLRPVYVLISPLCISAGEICALAMRALPNAVLVGENTAGMLSDNLNKPLPNGWQLSLSNEIYASADGHVFEGCGIPPKIFFPTLDGDGLAGALQETLRAVVAQLDG